jgi:hypothetical protein
VLIAADQVLVTLTMSEAVAVTGVPTYTITLDDGTTRAATYQSGASDPSGTHTLVFSYTVKATDLDLSGGITATANAFGVSTGVAVLDASGNAANLAVPVIAASANAVHIDPLAPTVTNARVLNGMTNLDVTSNIVLNFGSAVTHNVGGHITLVNDDNDAPGGVKTGYQFEETNHSIDLYLGDSSRVGDVTTLGDVTTVKAYQDSLKTIASGTVSIHNVTGLVTINPLYDLDLSNNYHVEIAADTFTKTSNGLNNVAFGKVTEGGQYALKFSTVSPGEASPSGILNSAAYSFTMSADGETPERGYEWVSVDTGRLGNLMSYADIELFNGNFALVIKNTSTKVGELGLGLNFYIALSNFGADDMVYFDDQNNAGPILFESNIRALNNAEPQSNGYGIRHDLAYDLAKPSDAPFYRGYVASIAFMGTAYDASTAALLGKVIVA